MKIIITENQLNFLISESGIRNINDLVIDMRNKFIDILQRKIDKN